MAESITLIRNLEDIDPAQWNALVDGNPLLSHAFLLALDQTGCAVPRTGWAPHYLVLHRDEQLTAAMPLYVKSHSRGEYVFDHSWANAFMQHGLAYYPKLLCAVPFTPVPGPRLLARTEDDRIRLALAATSVAKQNGLSSVHVLFPDTPGLQALEAAGFLVRENIQFHWHNRGYASFDAFLGDMTQKHRKKLKQDRKKVAQAGITFEWLTGAEISEGDMAFFYQCYEKTYFEHGNPPYLNPAFFNLLRAHLARHLVLIVAWQDNQPVASALSLRHGNTLYGRYWGSMVFVPGLHFETCYVQAIEYAIANGLDRFEGGAQGEHKLSRGMLPVKTWSAHWISDERFRDAIADFLERETAAIDDYADVLGQHSPFKQSDRTETPDRSD